MKKFVKYMHGSIDNASRNKRELSVVSKLNCEIIVCDFSEKEEKKEVNGYTVYRRKRYLSKCSLVRKFQILYNWLVKEPNYLRQKHAYCISCHDLTALFIGWLSTWFLPKARKPFLIYDSHEFELGRNARRSKFIRWIIFGTEKFLIKKCAFSIMVNDTIADEVQRIYKLKERPVVVRNIPPYWNVDESICKRRRKEFCEQLGVSEDIFIIMYHGGIMPGRGIENLLAVLQGSENTVAVILGYGEKHYIEKLRQMARDLQIEDRLLFHKAVDIDVLWQYVGAADAGVNLIQNIAKNHFYTLPNKLFENIQAETPIIASSFPELVRIIRGYDIGLCVDPVSIEEIVNAVEEMRTNKEMYNSFKRNLKLAKKELCWEKESKVLEEAYGKLLR